MATEIEMKLSVPSHEVMDQILQDPQLTQYMRDEPETRHMRSSYYDTEDGALCARRWTLRLRDEGGTPVVAMKTPNANAGTGLYTRHEWQCRAARPEEAVPRLVEQGAPASLMQLTQGKRLEAICRAEFDRPSGTVEAETGISPPRKSGWTSRPMCHSWSTIRPPASGIRSARTTTRSSSSRPG